MKTLQTVVQKFDEENNIKIQGIKIKKLRHLTCIDLVSVNKIIVAKLHGNNALTQSNKKPDTKVHV